MGTRYLLPALLVTFLNTGLFALGEPMTQIFDVRRLVGSHVRHRMIVEPAAMEESRVFLDDDTRFLSPHDLLVILESRVPGIESWRILEGRLECTAQPEQLAIIESTIHDLESALPRPITIECLFVPTALATHAVLADVVARGDELMALSGVTYLNRLTLDGVAVALSQERRVSAHDNFEVHITGPSPVTNPTITEFAAGVRFQVVPYLLPNARSVVLEFAGRASTVAFRKAAIGEEYSALELPIIDEAVVSTRVRLPIGQYAVVARVGGADGGVFIARATAPTVAPLADTRCWSYTLAPLFPLAERIWPARDPLGVGVFAPPRNFEGVGLAEELVEESRKRVFEASRISDLSSKAGPTLWWSESRLIVHGTAAEHSKVQKGLQSYYDRKFWNFSVTFTRLAVPRAVLPELLKEPGVLDSSWRQTIAQHKNVGLEEYSVLTFAETAFGLRHGRTHFYVRDFEVAGGCMVASPLGDPVVAPLQGGVLLEASLLVNPARPDCVDLRLLGAAREDVVIRPRVLEFPILIAADGNDFSVEMKKPVQIELASARLTTWNDTRTVLLGRDVIIEAAIEADSAYVTIVRVEEAP
ncbi:MAG: hypothetical protein ACKVX7_07965 [Planctomycetota bacterium]